MWDRYAPQRERQPNFSNVEEAVLWAVIKKYRSTIENKKTDSATNVLKKRAWFRVADEFNASSGEVRRSWTNLKKKYENMKKYAKKNILAQQEIKEEGQPIEPSGVNKTMEEILDRHFSLLELKPDRDAVQQAHSTLSNEEVVVPSYSHQNMGNIESQDEEEMAETIGNDDDESLEVYDITNDSQKTLANTSALLFARGNSEKPITWKSTNLSSLIQGNRPSPITRKKGAKDPLSDCLGLRTNPVDDRRKIMWEEHKLKLELMREKHALFLKQTQEEHEQKIRHREELHQADLAKRMSE